MGYLISVLVSAHTMFGFLMRITGILIGLSFLILIMGPKDGNDGDRQVTLLKKFLLPLFGVFALGFILTPGSVLG